MLAGSSQAGSREDLLVVVKDGKYGYIDDHGKVVIGPQFIWADDFWRCLGAVYVCGRYVSIDPSGSLHPVRIAAEGQLVPRKQGDKFGFVNASGRFAIAPEFDEVLPFSEGLAAVSRGKKWFFIDAAGHTVIDAQFKAAYYFVEGVAVAELESGTVLIDRSGKVLARGYDFPQAVADGRVPVSRDRKWGYLDLHGQEAIPLTFDSGSAFSHGLAAVRKDGKWGYINRDGQMVVPPQFDDAGPFSSGLAPVKLGDRTGFIDRSGKFAFFLDFDYAPGFLKGDEESNRFVAPSSVSRFWTTDGKFGYVNTLGRVIWGPVEGSPSHTPLFGWSEEDKVKSCEGISKSTRHRVAAFPH